MDEYDKDRDGFDNNQRGRIFEKGSDRFFRDRENGYVSGSRLYRVEGVGKIRFDKVRDDQGKVSSVEEKSGVIGGDKDENQLKAIYKLLETGQIQEHVLRSVEGERVSSKAQMLIDRLKEKFPDRFTHLEIARADAREIWTLGLATERGKGQQLEIVGVREKAREAKAKALENRREKIAEIVKVRDRKERARERLANIREIVKAREDKDRARAASELAARRVALEFPAPAQLRRIEAPTADRAKEGKTPETERDRVTREAAEKAVREFQARLAAGSTSAGKAPEKTTPERESPEAARARVEREAREQVLREFPFPVPKQSQEREAVEIGERPSPELADAASVEREAADKARAAEKEQQARDVAREQDAARNAAFERLQEQGRLTEVERLHWLGQATDPRGAVREPPGHAPGVERGGTGQAQGRDRGQSRDR
ncbi:hypothetical protein ACIA8C_19550 [Nocardia sp. NPDC051321]|uniref:hypothetical protein n=1 Tax=Nocardia sp. NPDC051321 TaxID=3364323 RepID=UPI0037A8EA65